MDCSIWKGLAGFVESEGKIWVHDIGSFSSVVVRSSLRGAVVDERGHRRLAIVERGQGLRREVVCGWLQEVKRVNRSWAVWTRDDGVVVWIRGEDNGALSSDCGYGGWQMDSGRSGVGCRGVYLREWLGVTEGRCEGGAVVDRRGVYGGSGGLNSQGWLR
ncbi:hypothetical protein CsSME_00053110 [Camellia sinensis var. sinensis]